MRVSIRQAATQVLVPTLMMALLGMVPTVLRAADDGPSAQPDEGLIQNLRVHFGLDLYDVRNSLKSVKVAILDRGFSGYDPKHDTFKVLPAGTKVVDRYPDDLFVRNQKYFEDLGIDRHYWDESFFHDARALDLSNEHGLESAQIIWKMTGGQPDGPQLFLLNARGTTNLFSAIAYAVEQKIDIILLAQNYYYGNGRGDGPVDRAVSHATKAGILFVNTSGNYGGSVYSGKLKFGPDGGVLFDNGKDYLEFEGTLSAHDATVVATWTDELKSMTSQSHKDLDVVVYRTEEQNGKIVEVPISGDLGNRRQADEKDLKPEEQSRRALYPKEEFSVRLALKGKYRIRVKAVTDPAKFTPSDDIRVAVYSERPGGEGVVFTDASHKSEIFPPADHPEVLTVGMDAPSSAVGPTLGETPLQKPEFVMDFSRYLFDSGDAPYGVSEGAAYFTSILAALKAQQPALDRAGVLRVLQTKARPTAELPPTEIAPEVWHELETATGLIQDQAHVEKENGTRVLSLPIKPSDILGWFPHDSEVVGQRYFIAGDYSAQDGWQYRISTMRWRGEMLPPALEVPEVDNSGQVTHERKWIELRQFNPARLGAGIAVWNTPSPEELAKAAGVTP